MVSPNKEVTRQRGGPGMNVKMKVVKTEWVLKNHGAK